MRTLFAWISVGVCICLAAVLAGQNVFGQPELPPLASPMFPPPPSSTQPAPSDLTPPPMPSAPTREFPKSVAQAVDEPQLFQSERTGPDIIPPGPPVQYDPKTRQVGFPPSYPQPVADPTKMDPGLMPLPPGSPGLHGIDTPNGMPGVNGVPQGRPGKNEPSVSVEWVGPTTANLNQAMPCHIMVRNAGSVAVHQVVVKHRLAEGTRQLGSEPPATFAENQMTWNLGTLEPGQTRRIDVQLVPGTRGPLHCQAAVTFTATSSLQAHIREPLLKINVKGPERVVAGEPVVFAITLRNPGDGVTENIRIKAQLPDGLEHPQGKVLEISAPQLAPKETRTIQMMCQAQGAGMQQTTFIALADGGLKSVDSFQLEILQPKLDLTVSGPKLRYIERHAVYALKVANPGSAPAANVTLTEVVPAGFKFHAASSGGRYDETTRTATWFLGDVMPGQTRDVNLELVAAVAGDHKLVGQVNTARGVKTDAEAQTRVEGLPSLQVEFEDDPVVEVGAETAYVIRITNIGTKTESNLQLACMLPEQMEFRGAKTEKDLRHRLDGRELVFEPIARLAPRADVIFRVHVKGIRPGVCHFRAQVRADSLTEPMIREETTRVYNDESPLR